MVFRDEFQNLNPFLILKKKKKNRILLNSNAQIHSKMADDGMVFRDW